MKKRTSDSLIIAASFAVIVAVLIYLTLRAPDSMDHVAPDAVWRREAGLPVH